MSATLLYLLINKKGHTYSSCDGIPDIYSRLSRLGPTQRRERDVLSSTRRMLAGRCLQTNESAGIAPGASCRNTFARGSLDTKPMEAG
nr:hypothetical protein CFP56_32225 [Quercus suber]